MASKRIKENVKDKSIHRTAKNKSVGGKEKISKPGKTTNLRRSSNERRTTSKSTQNKEKQPSNKETKQNSETEKQVRVKIYMYFFLSVYIPQFLFKSLNYSIFKIQSCLANL